MKRNFLFGMMVCFLALSLFMTGCSGQENNNLSSTAPSSTSSLEEPPQESPTQEVSAPEPAAPAEAESDLQIFVKADGQEIIFQLNNSSAAQDLYRQLPLSIWVENYGSNEKIFYPPEALDVEDAPLAQGPAGLLAYYQPWGDVVFFYDDCDGASGLYELGKAVSGAEQIEALTGEIQIGRVGEDTSENITKTETTSSPSMESISSESAPIQDETVKVDAEMKLNVQVGGSTFLATLEDNTAVDAFVEMMQNGPVTIQMSDYSGFEKVGSLGTTLPSDNRQTTTQAGDIVLYNSNQIVIFYGSNSWSYTRLGRIDDLTGWQDALGNGDVTVTFSLAK